MNVTGQHLLAAEHIQSASMYQAASAVNVNQGSSITRAFVSVRMCVYVTKYIKLYFCRVIFAIKILKILKCVFLPM